MIKISFLYLISDNITSYQLIYYISTLNSIFEKLPIFLVLGRSDTKYDVILLPIYRHCNISTFFSYTTQLLLPHWFCPFQPYLPGKMNPTIDERNLLVPLKIPQCNRISVFHRRSKPAKKKMFRSVNFSFCPISSPRPSWKQSGFVVLANFCFGRQNADEILQLVINLNNSILLNFSAL